MEVGRGEEETGFMTRTWLLGMLPLPWSEVKFLGFTTYGGELMEYKILDPSDFVGV